MTAPLREQLQMARINRVKRRVHEWWHANRCPACIARAGGMGGNAGAPGGLAQLFQQLGVTGVEVLPADEEDGAPGTPPNQAH